MRQLDRVGTALANALGFSTSHNEARLKVVCQGVDKNAQETIIIVEYRIRARSNPVVGTGSGNNNGNSKKNKGSKKSGGLKSPGNPKTPHKSLIQNINKRAAERG